MRVDLIFRFLGAIAFGIGGWYLGDFLTASLPQSEQFRYTVAISLAGLGLGLLVTPYLTISPIEWLRDRVHRLPLQDLVAGLIGLVIGLVVAALLAAPLSLLPSLFGNFLPFAAAIICGYIGIVTAVARKKDIFSLLGSRFTARTEGGHKGSGSHGVLVDTSAIIDGRIADISQTGFIAGSMIVPRFVLGELQRIADSADVLRRNRGRRGLDILGKLQKDSLVPIEIFEMDVNGVDDVDSKLVKLAIQMRCPIITNDFNLNRVAALQGVRVLNINELANAVKSVVLPGEEMTIRIIQEGKEHGQGVGYLDDGTMVVVEGGRRHLSNTVDVVVTRVLQTVAGRMIFAHPKMD
ncbi:MAG: PIN domain nuclease [Chloroflexi bacterium]|nr:PIN domain nuclease [Chloroflexota bacterium]